MWIEHYGDLIIENLRTGDTCKANFPQSSWWSGICMDVTGGLFKKDGTQVYVP